MQRIPEDVLERIEREHAQGITSSDILELFAAHGIKFSEATLRKYVQLGLLPRSVRVGRKGKSRGSQGLYPATVVRRLDAIRRLNRVGSLCNLFKLYDYPVIVCERYLNRRP